MSLLEHGYLVTIIDNLDNSFVEAFNRMKELAGDKADNMKFIEVRTAVITHSVWQAGTALVLGPCSATQPPGHHFTCSNISASFIILFEERGFTVRPLTPDPWRLQGDLRDLAKLEALFAEDK